MRFCQKLKNQNLFIVQPDDVVDLWYVKLWILCTLKKPKFEIRFTSSGFKELGITKFEFVAKIKILTWKIISPQEIRHVLAELQNMWRVLFAEYLGMNCNKKDNNMSFNIKFTEHQNNL